VLIAPVRPAYFSSFALSLRYPSIARRMSSDTGAPVFSDRTCNFLTCSALRNRAVRFMDTRYSIGIQMSIAMLGVSFHANEPQRSNPGCSPT
jgi:hypothetical protein